MRISRKVCSRYPIILGTCTGSYSFLFEASYAPQMFLINKFASASCVEFFNVITSNVA